MEDSCADNNLNYAGPAPKDSEGKNVTSWPRACSLFLVIFWQRLWLISALVQRIFLR